MILYFVIVVFQFIKRLYICKYMIPKVTQLTKVIFRQCHIHSSSQMIRARQMLGAKTYTMETERWKQGTEMGGGGGGERERQRERDRDKERDRERDRERERGAGGIICYTHGDTSLVCDLLYNTKTHRTQTQEHPSQIVKWLKLIVGFKGSYCYHIARVVQNDPVKSDFNYSRQQDMAELRKHMAMLLICYWGVWEEVRKCVRDNLGMLLKWPGQPSWSYYNFHSSFFFLSFVLLFFCLLFVCWCFLKVKIKYLVGTDFQQSVYYWNFDALPTSTVVSG